jgi:hypothetical protein
MTIPHLVTQALQSAKLELLDRSFAAAKLLGDLTYALFVNKAANNHETLVRWQAVHQLVEHSAPLGFGLHADHRFGAFQSFRAAAVFCRPTPAVSQCVGGDTQQPRGKRRATPLEASKVAQGFVKDLGGHILRFITVADPPRHKSVDATEVSFIKLRKLAGVLLCRFYQEPFTGKIANCAQRVPPGEPVSFVY